MPSLRYRALERIALLSASDPFSSDADLDSISHRCTEAVGRPKPDRPETGNQWTRFEVESTLALCKAAVSTQDGSSATALAYRLSDLLTASLSQSISLSYFVLNHNLSPWQLLAYNLTSALLTLRINHPQTTEVVDKAIWSYTSDWITYANSAEADASVLTPTQGSANDELLHQVIVLMTSFVGFANGISESTELETLPDKADLLAHWKKGLFGRMTAVMNGTVTTVRNSRQGGHRDTHRWKLLADQYDQAGQPLGSVTVYEAYSRMLAAFCGSQIRPNPTGLLDDLFLGDRLDGFELPNSDTFDPKLNLIANEEWGRLDSGGELAPYESLVEQPMVSAIRSYIIQANLFCALVSGKTDLLAQWLLESPFVDSVQMADPILSCVVLKCLAVLSRQSDRVATRMSQDLPIFLGQGIFQGPAVIVCAEALAIALKRLHPDTTIATLYSLSNLITPSNAVDSGFSNFTLDSRTSLPLASSDSEERTKHYSSTIHSIIQVIICVAVASGDEKIINLALSMLVQKIELINSSVDALIISESAVLGAKSAPNDFKRHLDFLDQVCHKAFVKSQEIIIKAVAVARNYLSMIIKRDSDLFEVYLLHMVNAISSKGEVQDEHRTASDMELSAREIGELLSPLASLVSANSDEMTRPSQIEGLPNLVRDAWYNIVVHGYSYKSAIGKRYLNTLQVLAHHSSPLITKDRAGEIESDIELNTVLRRGEGSEQTAEHKRYLTKMLPICEHSIKSLSYSEAVFLKTAHLMETLRARSGNCTEVLTYFSDPRLQTRPSSLIESRPKTSHLGICMQAVATETFSTYLSQTVSSSSLSFSSYHLASQLATTFAQCCHRIQSIQAVAVSSADLIIESVPSALCQKKSLFTMLDLMTLLWDSCLERETDEYGWKSSFTTPHANLVVELPDNFVSRQETLQNFHQHATRWMKSVIDIAPLDAKELLQAYLSDPDSEVSPGHISFGRSFAIEMGSTIPSTDPRLKSIKMQQGLNVNSASDFIAQYTYNQRYKLIGSMINSDRLGLWFDTDSTKSERSLRELETKLEEMYDMITRKDNDVPWEEVSVSLRHAGAILSGANTDRPRIVQYLVRIPFAVFSKESIKQGIALWTAVMKSNPRMESRIFVEIAERWEQTINRRVGLFDPSFRHPDPFFEKQEFAPSSKTAISRRQSLAYSTISPHLRLVRFLSSHFQAINLYTPQLRRIYIRLVHKGLDGLSHAADHPLVRECHYQLVLLGFDVLRNTPDFSTACRWRLLDRILTGGLAWFKNFPRWSYGGNRLQIKAEVELIERLKLVLSAVDFHREIVPEVLDSIEAKRRLFKTLLEDELSRLMVWLYPLQREHRSDIFLHPHSQSRITRAAEPEHPELDLHTACTYCPLVAVRMSQRFSSPIIHRVVRKFVMQNPEKLLEEPAALELMLGTSLPNESGVPLNYLLYWAPVNPITAASYLLPAYENNPFVIQYALRALDSHSVDITFFYVPQIVQTLRYDVLGYAERYILEAGMVSQLFAHQIIWNMQANMYKDEDSQIPDGIKPTLDRVMDHLVNRFTPEDLAFYKREFSFFDEVTSISGKLKPFIKKTKPEKKQKIDEELRKIKLEVGVYLPSNPDGVVVGIDRQSGRPLQSHAKAPFMATFRIRRVVDAAEVEPDNPDFVTEVKEEVVMTYREMWQSAIFKVGDDCRQDVLVLQLISTFRNIFHDVGLDVFVFPYRVTATAPGCGVIDVLPNSISRDMLGREAVNGLYDYFVSKYGGEDSIRFQVARSNFVKSMAAYSLISYLLQLKDRHNGNIMIDDAGHLIHIDFGFCFEIAPGGIKFERAPFKLTAEMVAVMGGSISAQPFVWFEELCVKAFLACRQHCDHLLSMATVMLGSGLPCFGNPNSNAIAIKNFRDRFVLNYSEAEAVEHMRELVKKSYGSSSTKGYDYFQLRTNGIPY